MNSYINSCNIIKLTLSRTVLTMNAIMPPIIAPPPTPKLPALAQKGDVIIERRDINVFFLKTVINPHYNIFSLSFEYIYLLLHAFSNIVALIYLPTWKQ